MIRELTREEIREKEAYIKTLEDKEEYKYYFTEEEAKEPLRAWVDGGYYADLTEFDGVYAVGVIKLYDEPCGFGFMALVRKLVQEYGRIFLWCYLENKESMRFHKLLERKLSAKRITKDGVSVVMLERSENV